MKLLSDAFGAIFVAAERGQFGFGKGFVATMAGAAGRLAFFPFILFAAIQAPVAPVRTLHPLNRGNVPAAFATEFDTSDRPGRHGDLPYSKSAWATRKQAASTIKAGASQVRRTFPLFLLRAEVLFYLNRLVTDQKDFHPV